MDNQALYQLMSWMSPSYPVGAYTYSHGIEYAVEAGMISGLDDLVPWISDILEHGSGKSDAIFLKAAYSAVTDGQPDELNGIAELANAFCSTTELALETEQQGRAFIRVISDVAPSSSISGLVSKRTDAITYPVAVGIVAADNRIPLSACLTAYLHGFVSNLVSAAVRIIPLGQTDGQRAISRLAGAVEAASKNAELANIENLGTATLMVDWCSSKHETQYTRLFRS
jgi:urease accessory protein